MCIRDRFTSESVTEGHPDKVCDQISDAVLDAILAKETELAAAGYVAPSGQPADPAQVRVACETMATTGMVIVTGEIRTQAYVDVPAIVREVLRDIGYDRAKYGFDCDTCGVLNAIHDQSPDIAQGVDESWEAQHGLDEGDPYERVGAGDQGTVSYTHLDVYKRQDFLVLVSHGCGDPPDWMISRFKSSKQGFGGECQYRQPGSSRKPRAPHPHQNARPARYRCVGNVRFNVAVPSLGRVGPESRIPGGGGAARLALCREKPRFLPCAGLMCTSAMGKRPLWEVVRPSV